MNRHMEDKYAGVPFAPKRLPFFYGWIIVLLGGMGILVSMPGQTMGVSAFKSHMRDALGISDVAISTAYMIGTILSSLMLTPVGKLLDRFGVRIVAPVAALLMGSTTFLLARCDKLSGLLSRGPLSSEMSAVIVMIFLFLLLRFSGQGVLTLSCRNMVVKWFNHRRGLATGIMGFLTQPGFAATPFFFYLLVNSLGWRRSWEILGGVAIFIFVPLAFLLFRDNPEACGLVPDGRDFSDDDKKGRIHTVYRQYDLSEARRTMAFWVFVGPAMIFAMFGTAITFHIESIFGSVGLNRTTAFASFIPGCIISMMLRPIFGRLADSVRLQHILRIELFGLMLMMLGISFLGEGLMLWAYFIGGGIASALFTLILSVTWPTFFGRDHLGAISAFAMSLLVFGSAIGPWFFSKLEALSGSYRLPALISLGVTACFFIASLFTRNPQEAEAKTA
jgi:OFA family oxalate/formate antiporter-like MFS transporter